ncbi:MAG: phosphotransferase [Methylacidiphilaceae bacterium]|nr:phosphotransferase [Candidatus Methylacidiphilaceae bacterium]
MIKVQVGEGVFEENQLVPDRIDAGIGRIGGSHAGTRVIPYLRKEAKGDGARKLKDEVQFLLRLPQDIAEKFPRVIRYYASPSAVAMEQEFVQLPTLRKILCEGEATAGEGIEWVKRILDFLFSRVYSREARIPPDDYLEQLHFLRAWARFAETMSKAPLFEGIILADRIYVQGEECYNAPQILRVMEEDAELHRILRPSKVSPFVHGDLHFDNILVSRDTRSFKLVDPRGYEYCDPWYDAGKLYHSARGKYDLIHRGEFRVDWTVEEQGRVEIDLKFYSTPAYHKYQEISENLEGLLMQYAPEENVAMLSLFNEAIHFISDMPFHLSRDEKEAKAVAIYGTGVWLLNRLLKDHCPNRIAAVAEQSGRIAAERIGRASHWKFQGNAAA